MLVTATLPLGLLLSPLSSRSQQSTAGENNGVPWTGLPGVSQTGRQIMDASQGDAEYAASVRRVGPRHVPAGRLVRGSEAWPRSSAPQSSVRYRDLPSAMTEARNSVVLQEQVTVEFNMLAQLRQHERRRERAALRRTGRGDGFVNAPPRPASLRGPPRSRERVGDYPALSTVGQSPSR